jgi:hypothetical protein
MAAFLRTGGAGGDGALGRNDGGDMDVLGQSDSGGGGDIGVRGQSLGGSGNTGVGVYGALTFSRRGAFLRSLSMRRAPVSHSNGKNQRAVLVNVVDDSASMGADSTEARHTLYPLHTRHRRRCEQAREVSPEKVLVQLGRESAKSLMS